MDYAGLKRLLATAVLPIDTEVAMQDAIEGLLAKSGVDFVREKVLSTSDRVDFFVSLPCGEGIAVECKVKGSEIEIYRQLKRYASHAVVSRILLVTSRTKRMPPLIGIKPAETIHVARAWL